MQAEQQQINPLERRLDIEFPQTDVETEVDSRLKRLVRTAKFPGFRPGKVPYKLVAQQYGMQVRQEVLADSLQRAFSSAVKEQNFRVVGYPRFDPKDGADAADKFEFTATFEVFPEIEIQPLGGAPIKKPEVVVADKEIDKTIEVLRKQRTNWIPVTRAVQTGDRAQISFEGRLDGVAFEEGKADKQFVLVGDGQLYADFEKNLIGLAPGASSSFEVTFPEHYPGTKVAGKTVNFSVTVHSVDAPELPPVDAEFAKSLGVGGGDLSKLRDEIKANLEREVGRRVKGKLKDQVMQILLDAAKFDVPKALVDVEVDRLRQGAMQDMQGKGLATNGTNLPAELFAEAAQRRARLGLIVSEIVKRHSLQARPEQVRTLIDDFAKNYEQPEAMVSWYYQQSDRMREVEAIVLEDNVVSWVMAQAKTETVATPFDELMESGK